jgi:hypothetical protein
VLCNNESILKWNWLEEPLDAKGAAEIAEVHKDWFSTFPDLKVSLRQPTIHVQ